MTGMRDCQRTMETIHKEYKDCSLQSKEKSGATETQIITKLSAPRS